MIPLTSQEKTCGKNAEVNCLGPSPVWLNSTLKGQSTKLEVFTHQKVLLAKANHLNNKNKRNPTYEDIFRVLLADDLWQEFRAHRRGWQLGNGPS